MGQAVVNGKPWGIVQMVDQIFRQGIGQIHKSQNPQQKHGPPYNGQGDHIKFITFQNFLTGGTDPMDAATHRIIFPQRGNTDIKIGTFSIF